MQNGTLIQNPDRRLMALIQLKHRLKLEISTPLKMRPVAGMSTLQLANHWLGRADLKTKKAALAAVLEELEKYSR